MSDNSNNQKMRVILIEPGKDPEIIYLPAGNGVHEEAIQDILGYEEIPKIMADTGEFFCLRVEGNSMYPLLYSGETIVITCPNGETGTDENQIGEEQQEENHQHQAYENKKCEKV